LAPEPTRHDLALLAFSALAVAMAYRYQPVFLFFPARSFHLGLFFFAAGHLAQAPMDGRHALSLLRRQARTLLVPLYGASLCAALAALWLSHAGYAPGGAVPSFESGTAALESLRALLVWPLGFAEGPALLAPGWLLAQAFLAGALFLGLSLLRNRLALWAALLLSAGAALALFGEDFSGLFGLLAGRAAYALAFYLAGALVKSAGEPARERLLSPLAMVASFAAADVLGALFGTPVDPLEPGLFATGVGPAALLRSAAQVLLVYQLAAQAARIAGERSLLFGLGRASGAVLLWQSAAFFAVTGLFALAGKVARAQAQPGFMFEPNKTWVLYLGAALLLPPLGARLLRRRAGAALP
jgi:fucose 4-O-acetylase-like acetyltransferase